MLRENVKGMVSSKIVTSHDSIFEQPNTTLIIALAIVILAVF